MQQRANERQVGGTHYAAAYQHWDWATDIGLFYIEGQVPKYLKRWKDKDGLEDVQKAGHFTDKIIEVAPLLMAYRAMLRLPEKWVIERTTRYVEANKIVGKEAAVTWLIATWANVEDLCFVRKRIDEIVEDLATQGVQRLRHEPPDVDGSQHAKQLQE